MRRLAGTRKVGHAGTLDPMATGVLVLGVGRATRLLGYLDGTRQGRTTRRSASARGRSPTTPKVSVVAAGAAASGVDRCRRSARRSAPFVGDIEQVPSSVSAVKVDGERSYARVRAGRAGRAVRPPRPVDRFDVR